MQTLKEAVHNFHSSFFGSSAELLDRLGRGDEWIAAIVTCSELGTATELAVKARPGELYIVQNFGNLVPGQQFDNGGGPTVSSIQYAINQLGVKHVIVSGHMKCRTVELLLKDAEAERYSHWLEQAGRTRQVISEQYDHLDAASRIRAACQEIVLVQLENLQSHPFIRQRLSDGELRWYAWIFDDETGQLFSYEPETGQFAKVNPRDETD